MFASPVLEATKARLDDFKARKSMKKRVKTLRVMAAITMVVVISACVQTLPLAQRTEPQPAATAATTTTTTREAASATQARQQVAPVTRPAAATAATPVSYSTEALRGEWVGVIDCGSGPVPLQLLIIPIAPAGMLAAMGSLPGWKGGGVANFHMKGDMSANQIRMRWERWAYKPLRFPEIDVDASWNGDSQRIAARVINNPKCKAFELQRRTVDNMRVAIGTPPAAAIATGSAAKGMSHAEFVKRLGSQKLPSLVGTTLQLDLKRGGDGGWNGYIEDPQSMVFFSCQTTAPAYKGGPLTAKIGKLKSNDNGVYVTLDRCGA